MLLGDVDENNTCLVRTDLSNLKYIPSEGRPNIQDGEEIHVPASMVTFNDSEANLEWWRHLREVYQSRESQVTLSAYEANVILGFIVNAPAGTGDERLDGIVSSLESKLEAFAGEFIDFERQIEHFKRQTQHSEYLRNAHVGQND